MEWVDAASRHGIAIRVLEAETGVGKSYVAQTLYDQLANKVIASIDPDSGYTGYWRPGLAPAWPQTAPTRIEQDRKTVIPSMALRNLNGDSPLGFAWIGLPLGEVAASSRVDLAGQLLEQLAVLQEHCVAMHEDRVRHRALVGAAGKTVGGVAKFGAGLVAAAVAGPFAPLIGLGGVALSSWKPWREGLVNPSEARRSAARQEIVDALKEIRDLALKFGEPLVIVLDDAHAVRSDVLELLGLLTGLTAPELTDEQDVFASGGFSDQDDERESAGENAWRDDAASGWEPPDHRIPILIVATTWPGESRVRTGGLFDEWLARAESTLADRPGAVSTIRLDPIPRKAAIAMLRKSGVTPELVVQMVDHLGEVRHGEAVNALVLAGGRAEVDADLSGAFSPGLTLERISELPTAPTFHIEQRIEWLREVKLHGEDAYGLLKQLAEWGAAVPLSAATRLAALPRPSLDADVLLALLAQRRMIELPDPDAPIALLSIQVDLQAFIAEENLSDGPIRSIAIDVRNDALNLIRNEYDRGRPRVPLADLQRIVGRSKQLDPFAERGPEVSRDAYDALAWILTPLLDRPEISEDDQLQLLKSAAASGISRFAAWAACQMALIVPREEALKRLLPLVAFYPPAAFRAAALSPDRDDKIKVLERAGNNPQVLVQLAKLYPDPENKIKVLERAGNDPDVLMQLATLYPEREDKIKVLERAGNDLRLAVRLAWLYPELVDQLRVLEPFTTRDASAAYAQVRLLLQSISTLPSEPNEFLSHQSWMEDLPNANAACTTLLSGIEMARRLLNSDKDRPEGGGGYPLVRGSMNEVESRAWAMGVAYGIERSGLPVQGWKRVFELRWHDATQPRALRDVFFTRFANYLPEDARNRDGLVKLLRKVIRDPEVEAKHVVNWLQVWVSRPWSPRVIRTSDTEILCAVAVARACVKSRGRRGTSGTSRPTMNLKLRDLLEKTEESLVSSSSRLRSNTEIDWSRWKDLCPELVQKLRAITP
jgi:hypothetical protein